MPGRYFQFKQFKVYHDKCAMKVGTDGVLLGAWADVTGANSILDIGTGTGLLALMMAQRSDALITAVEIDKDAFIQAVENAKISLWNNRISVIDSSFQEYYSNHENKFDMIISNPPYYSNSLKSPDINKIKAKHTDKLSFKDLLSGSQKLLSQKGRLCIILPLKETNDFIMMAKDMMFFPARLTEVRPDQNKPPIRMMMEFKFTYESLIQTTLNIRNEEDKKFSDDYKKLTKDFYLNF